MRKKIISAMLICAGFPVGSLYAVHPAPVTRIQSVQQNGACTGVVKDASGEAVIGASVTVDGTTNGTITDLDGNFSLPNVPKGSTIKISFVGYKTLEVKWNGSPLNIILKEDSEMLDEVVVVGYGTQKKVNVTGAVSMVGAEVIESRPVANVTQALQVLFLD